MKRIAWGEWVRCRLQHVGFRSNTNFAIAVGCSRGRIQELMSYEEPPTTMRKGLDESIATALQTNRITLFSDWRSIAPDRAPLLDAIVPANSSSFEGDSLKRQVHAVVELLDADRLRELHERGRELLREEMSAPAA